MTSQSKAILIEFNELAAPLLEQFMAKGALPNFKRFFNTSTIYTTTASDDPLEPWIQWPSVHCGVPYAEHRALHLGDGRHIEQKAVGTILSEHGIRVGIFGMINGNYRQPNGYYLPDPWDARDRVSPAELLPFYDFVAHQVKENTRHAGVRLEPALRFAAFMTTHGLSLPSALAVVSHLLLERIKPQLRWRRAPLLDLLQYDVFRHLNRKYAVRFASFFSNSTAHLQHYFWRNMDPRGFDEQPDPDADPSLQDAILFGYRSMDRILGYIMHDYPEHRLMLCTGLSQEPWFQTTKCTYRPVSFDEFLRFANIPLGLRVVPVMAERFRLECANEIQARETKAALDRLAFRGRPLMCSILEGTNVHTGCTIIDAGNQLLDEVIHSDSQTSLFGSLFYRITAMNSGRHHCKGSLWIRDGTHDVVADPVPLEAIAPTILSYFGIEAPAPMRREYRLDKRPQSGVTR